MFEFFLLNLLQQIYVNQQIFSTYNFSIIKDYIAKKVRLKFDPPTGSAMDALKQVIDELEWRINVEVDPGSDSGGLAKNKDYLIIKN